MILCYANMFHLHGSSVNFSHTCRSCFLFSFFVSLLVVQIKVSSAVEWTTTLICVMAFCFTLSCLPTRVSIFSIHGSFSFFLLLALIFIFFFVWFPLEAMLARASSSQCHCSCELSVEQCINHHRWSWTSMWIRSSVLVSLLWRQPVFSSLLFFRYWFQPQFAILPLTDLSPHSLPVPWIRLFGKVFSHLNHEGLFFLFFVVILHSLSCFVCFRVVFISCFAFFLSQSMSFECINHQSKNKRKSIRILINLLMPLSLWIPCHLLHPLHVILMMILRRCWWMIS